MCIYLRLVFTFTGYHLYLAYAKCPLFSLSFAFSLMHSSVHTKNSNAYNSTCVIDIAFKLQLAVSQGLHSYE